MKTKTIKELQQLSDEELKQLALQRHKTGRKKSTTTALRAQLVLWQRAGRPFQSEPTFHECKHVDGILKHVKTTYEELPF